MRQLPIIRARVPDYGQFPVGLLSITTSMGSGKSPKRRAQAQSAGSRMDSRHTIRSGGRSVKTVAIGAGYQGIFLLKSEDTASD
jgi:hypothetical protein